MRLLPLTSYLFLPVLRRCHAEAGLEVVVEGGGMLEAGGLANLDERHLRMLHYETAGIVEAAVAHKLGQRLTAALREGCSHTRRREREMLHDGRTVEVVPAVQLLLLDGLGEKLEQLLVGQ